MPKDLKKTLLVVKAGLTVCVGNGEKKDLFRNFLDLLRDVQFY